MDISTPLNIARGDSPSMNDFDVIHTAEPIINADPITVSEIDPLNICEFSMQIEPFTEPDPLEELDPKFVVSLKECVKKSDKQLSKDAERMRAKRKGETGKNRENRRARAAYLARIRRQNMPANVKEKMRIADKERAKMKRATESPEEREARNKRDAERKRKRRSELAQFKKLLEQLEAGTANLEES